MAMLAETRRKQKWTLNPRGKQWSDDSNKFGQKMLEKMGWSRGKGLGANEQGMTEHVKVGLKNDQAGIGYKDNNDQWTQHQTDFNDFLSQLQTDGGPKVKPISKEGELSGKSLEIKSKLSRARVHYHKFTRGKDVNKYSAKDLATIFGKKDPIANIKVETVDTPPESTEPIGSKDNTGGVLTIKGGNISDYFKNKLPNFVKKHSNEVNTEDNSYDSETEHRAGFGFSSIEQGNESSQCQEEKNKFVFENAALDLNSPVKDRPTPKKRKSEFVFENSGLDLDYPEKPKRSKSVLSEVSIITDDSNITTTDKGFVNTALNLDTLAVDTCNGLEFEVSRVPFGLDNNALDITDETSTKKRVTFNDKVEYSTDLEKKKKKKKKAKGKLDKFEVENRKIKKKDKVESVEQTPDEKIGFVNEALNVEIRSEEINDNEVNERKSKKAKRKKERKLSILETIQEAPEEDREVDIVNLELNQIIIPGSETMHPEETEAPKKKKKKKKDKEEIVIPVITLEDNELNVEKKKKKKKDKKPELISIIEETPKKKKNEKDQKVEDTTEDGKENVENLPEIILEVVVKKKKEKKRRKSTGDVTTDSISPENEELKESSRDTRRKIESNEDVETPSKKNRTEDIQKVTNLEMELNIHSPWNKQRKNKKVIKSFFARSPILHFNGSNINEIRGYGADIK